MNYFSPDKYEIIEEKRVILSRVLKWLNGEETSGEANFDIPQLSIVMQLLGFKLQKFEKLDVVYDSDTTITVEFTCNKSGMRSVLSKTNATCMCPLDDDVSKGQFWTITGCGPSSQEHINVSTSSLLPTISSTKSKIIVTLLNGALSVINSATKELNKPELLPDVVKTPTSPSFKRTFSLDTFTLKERTALKQRGLKRQLSWEVDPRTSPVDTSSPLSYLCGSMERVSLNSDNSKKLVLNLKSIQKLVDESIEIASGSKTSTFTKTAYKRVSDIKPTEGPTAEELRRNAPVKQKSTTPRRIITPQKKLANDLTKKNLTTLILTPKSGLLRKKVGLPVKSSPIAMKKIKNDIRMPTLSKKTTASTNSCERGTKSKIASYVGLTPKSGSKTLKSGEPSSSNTDIRFRKVIKLPANYKPITNP